MFNFGPLHLLASLFLIQNLRIIHGESERRTFYDSKYQIQNKYTTKWGKRVWEGPITVPSSIQNQAKKYQLLADRFKIGSLNPRIKEGKIPKTIADSNKANKYQLLGDRVTMNPRTGLISGSDIDMYHNHKNVPWLNSNKKMSYKKSAMLNDVYVPGGPSNIDSNKKLAQKLMLDNADDLNPRIGFKLDDSEMKKFKIWPQGIIPYYLDDRSFDREFRIRIRIYLQFVNQETGLRFTEVFRPHANDKKYVFFINRRGVLNCPEHTLDNFTNSGAQKFILGYDCLAKTGLMSANIMALIGIPSQHNSPDRDDYIEVMEDNIEQDKSHLFQKVGDQDWLFHDLEYDFNSVTHYHFHKYTKNGKATIVPKVYTRDSVGDEDTFSPTDLRKINMLYGYISKLDNPDMSQTQCSQLFVPGDNFENYKPISQKVLALQKPAKYTGEGKITDTENTKKSAENLTAEKQESKEDDNVTGEKFTSSEKVTKPIGQRLTSSEKTTDVTGEIVTSNENTKDVTGEKVTSGENAKKLKRLPRQLKHLLNLRNADYMSDYGERSQ